MKKMIILAVFLPALSAWAGDLSVDNLTVSNAVAVGGTISISGSVMTGTNDASATGGIITTNGNYRIHTFTNNGTFTVSSGSLSCDVLVVAGGGGGGGQRLGGGGGAGGLLYTSLYTVGAGYYDVTVGAGGAGGTTTGDNGKGGDNGFGSSFSDILIATGGGGGGALFINGADGGSGGGAGHPYPTHGHGIVGQGHDGGINSGSESYSQGGGGGAGTVGSNATASVGGDGGAGLSYDISGVSTYYAGGGGGSSDYYTPGAGGSGGGGAGSNGGGVDGSANTGGGGGGAERDDTAIGGSGGSGIVIVRYQFTTSSNVTTLSISSNGINQANASGSNVFMGKVGIGTENPAEKLHVAGNIQVDGTNIVSSMTLGGETRTNWPNVAVGALISSNNLSDVDDPATARANLGLGSAATNDAGVFLSPTSDGSQLTNITAAQVGALSTNAGALIAANNLSDVANAGAARTNLGLGSAAINDAAAFLSATGGVVNGNVNINGSVSVDAPAGDVPMGVYTSQ